MVSAAEKRVASCVGKKRFSTWAQAVRTAHRQAQKRKEKFSPYACHDCGGVHIGTHLGDKPSPMGSDQRYRYIVFARNQAGSEFVVGWANVPDGGRVAEIARETPGWELSRIVERKARAS